MHIASTRLFTILGTLALSILATVSCLSCLNGDFVFDDAEAILNNKDILPSTPVWNIFQNDFWGTDLRHEHSHKSYRPLTVLCFRLNYVLSGGFQSYRFHAVNLFLHVVVSVLTWSVFSKILGEGRTVTAFIGAIIFATHPVHTEAVCGIVGLADLLSTLFFMVSFLCYTHSDVSSVVGCTWLAACLLSALCALLCKEQGITVLGYCCIYDVIALKKLNIFNFVKMCWKVLDRRKEVDRSHRWAPVAILVLFGAAAVCARCYLMNFQGPSFQPVDNPASHAGDWLTRTLSYNYVFCINLWLLLCPIWLCFDWSMGCIPLVTLLDVRLLAVLALWFCLGNILVLCGRARSSQRQRDVVLASALLVLPFLPASNLLFTVGFVIAERVLYLPSSGFCLLVACGIEVLIRRFPLNKNDVMFGLSLLLLVFLLRSHDRSQDWKTESSLFSSGLSVCPDNAKVHYNVAKSAADAGDVARAFAEYRRAIELYPEYSQALNNLGNMLKHQGLLDEAEDVLRRALRIRPTFPAAWMNLGIVLASRRQFKEAEVCYLNAIKFRKNYPDCYYNLGNMYLEQKLYSQAESAWITATQLNPSLSVAWNNLVMLLDNLADHEGAVETAQQALSHLPREPALYFNLANALGKLSRFEESEQQFLAALSLNPENALYHVNLGVLYHRWQQFGKAESAYKKALTINPKLRSARENYALLKKSIVQNKQT